MASASLQLSKRIKSKSLGAVSPESACLSRNPDVEGNLPDVYSLHSYTESVKRTLVIE
jgi:hypothetical protein